jgi:PAS domain-containing protein
MIIPASRRDEEAEILEKIRRGARIKNYETFAQRKNGELFPISVTVSPIRDGDGKIIGASRIVRDITEYAKTLEILRSAEERYALALSGMSIGVWDWDLKTGKMFESESLRAIIGTASPEHIADCETFTDRIHQDDRQAVAERLRAHFEKREKFDVVYRMRVGMNQECRFVWSAR